MYVPAWSPLSPGVLLRRSNQAKAQPYPLSANYKTSYYVARAGIHALFKTLRLHGVDTVLAPDYHSGNEVSAIRAAGVRIAFYSIGRDFSPDLDELHRMTCEGSIGALYVIHYIGWPQPSIEEIRRLCNQRGILLIEDCALAFLSCRGEQPLGTFGDYSIFCLYKTLPVPNGGMLVQNCAPVAELNISPSRQCSAFSLMGRSAELVLSWLRLRSEPLGNVLFGFKTAIGRGLTRAKVERIPVGDIGFDISRMDLGMSSIGSYLMRRFDYGLIVRRRRQNFLRLVEKLDGAVQVLRKDLDDGVCPLFCPILVRDKHAVACALQKFGIESVEFWNRGDAEAERRHAGASRFLRKHLLELPIHQDVSPERIDYIADRVRVAAR